MQIRHVTLNASSSKVLISFIPFSFGLLIYVRNNTRNRFVIKYKHFQQTMNMQNNKVSTAIYNIQPPPQKKNNKYMKYCLLVSPSFLFGMLNNTTELIGINMKCFERLTVEKYKHSYCCKLEFRNADI